MTQTEKTSPPSIPRQIANGFLYVYRALRFLPTVCLHAQPRVRWLSYLTVFGLIFWSLVPKYTTCPPETPEERAHETAEYLRDELDLFAADTGRYPYATEGLTPLSVNPGIPHWHGPYATKIPTDPWGNPYGYIPPTSKTASPTIYSSGPDLRPGGADDIIYPDPTDEPLQPNPPTTLSAQ